LLGDTEALDDGKVAWMEGDAWQPLRRYIEDCLIVRDPFELFVAQNAALDGLLYPLIYERIVDDYLSTQGGSAVAMLCQFMNDWFDETSKWIDAVLKTVTTESDANREQLETWTTHYSAKAASAMLPIVRLGLADAADEAVTETVAAFKARMKKAGIAI
jgi:phenol hydroxylase P1 protein